MNTKENVYYGRMYDKFLLVILNYMQEGRIYTSREFLKVARKSVSSTTDKGRMHIWMRKFRDEKHCHYQQYEKRYVYWVKSK